MPTKKTEKHQTESVKKSARVKKEIPEPLMASLDENLKNTVVASRLSNNEDGSFYRRNSASSITKLDRFANLESGVAPFIYNTGRGNYSSNISAKDSIVLCQKAYWNVPIFRNTIDLMTEFSISNIYLTGGNEQSRKFFSLWLSKIDSWDLQDQFYREFYRSGNVFLYKFSADFSRDTMMKIQEAFGENNPPASVEQLSEKSIPIKYIVLNPSDINIINSSSFLNAVYVKILNDYELNALLNPKTEEDRKIVEKIPEIKKFLEKKKTQGGVNSGLNNVGLELQPERLIAVFYKKQNYEPLSVPMGFAVLEDINAKIELKKIDQAIARSVQQAVLLITMGDEKIGLPSEKNLTAMRRLFENQSVGKVLVADYTTDARFVIPDIGSLLDPKKYEILDNDIRMGLNSILFGEEKFSNTSIKVKVFFARLKYGREKFLKSVIIPEMKEIGKKLGFKQIPEPKLEDVDFEDNVLMSRVYSRLVELGVLTPEEALNVFDTGRLPSFEESVESQKRLKDLRSAGYYQPMIGGAQQDGSAEEGVKEKKSVTSLNSGRPSGSNTKQSVQRTVKASESEFFSCSKMKEVIVQLTSLEKQAEEKLKKKYKIKKLNSEQVSVAQELAFAIIQNEERPDWNNSIDKYIDNPSFSNLLVSNKIDDLAAVHGLDLRCAAILYHSKK